MINATIMNSLKPLNVPVSLLKYSGTNTTYIVFQEYLGQGETFSEDEEETTGHYILINLFTKGDNTSLVEQIKVCMKNNGFKRQNEHDSYEADTAYFNHVFHFFYSENII